MSLDSIWVTHPVSGRQINVAPLLSAFDAFDSQETFHSTGARDAIRRTIRALNKTVHDPQINSPIHVAAIYADLHLLEDAFEQMVERPLSE